jgi:hypothetical protein
MPIRGRRCNSGWPHHFYVSFRSHPCYAAGMQSSDTTLTRSDRLALILCLLAPHIALAAALRQAPRFNAEYEWLVRGGSEALPSSTKLILFHYQFLTALTVALGLVAALAVTRLSRKPSLWITAVIVAVASLAAFIVHNSLSTPLIPVVVGFE